MTDNPNAVATGLSGSVSLMRSLRFHHLGISVPSLDQAVELYCQLFGYKLVSGPFEDPIQRVTVCFLERGEAREVAVELVAPLSGDSPVRNVLAKGGGAYHICFATRDIEGDLAVAATHGCIVVSQPLPAVAFSGRRIAWFYTSTRQLVELVEEGISLIP